jgi:hypothetical protein
MQLNDSVDLGGHNTNRNLVASGEVIDLGIPLGLGLA